MTPSVAPGAAHNTSHRIKDLLTTGMVCEPLTGVLAVAGAYNSGTLQFYDARRDRHLAELDVARRCVVNMVVAVCLLVTEPCSLNLVH